MPFLRTPPSNIDIYARRLADFNRYPVGRRRLMVELGNLCHQLVLCDNPLKTPRGLKYYVSLKYLEHGYSLRSRHPYNRLAWKVIGEECFLVEEAELAVRAFLDRKFGQPKDVTGKGRKPADLKALLRSSN